MDIQRVETYMKRVAESETKTFRIHRNGGAG